MIRPIAWHRIRLLIIDLDNTLCDTLHTLSHLQWRRVESAFERKGWTREMAALHAGFGKHSFLHALRSARLTPTQIRFAIRIYDDVDVTGLTLFSDAPSLLAVPLPKILLSRGEPSLQRKKIAHLKIRSRFSEVRIVPTFERKHAVLQDILRDHDMYPKEVLVIGDRIEEEIADARSLGIPSVLVRRPDWPVGKSRVKPDMTVRDLHVVARALESASRTRGVLTKKIVTEKRTRQRRPANSSSRSPRVR